MITISPICYDLTRHDLLAGLQERTAGRFTLAGRKA
jgi:hypothetical protein